MLAVLSDCADVQVRVREQGQPMEVMGARVVFAPGAAAVSSLFILSGVLLGTFTGLIPGFHVNALALLLAAVAHTVPGPPHLVTATLLAAAIVHSFLDIVPTLALGVPDPSMAVSALPGHRLVAEGRGREALRLSALGSGGAVLLALPLAVPVTVAMGQAYPTISRHLPVILGLVVFFLLVTERGTRGRVGAVLALVGSGLLGVSTLPLEVSGLLPTGDLLTPLFGGLFGAPILLEALSGGGVPSQEDAAVRLQKFRVGATGAAGTIAGAIVGFVPGVSSAIAATIALTAVPRDTGARGFIVATSGVNTSNAVFALLALVTLGTPRTGVMVAIERARLPLNVPLLLATVVAAAALGTVLVLLIGDAYLRVVGRMDYARLCLGVLGMLTLVSFIFGGLVGLGSFFAASLVGLIPGHFGTRRVHLMGVLMVPLAV
jgi:putative membrane protein